MNNLNVIIRERSLIRNQLEQMGFPIYFVEPLLAMLEIRGHKSETTVIVRRLFARYKVLNEKLENYTKTETDNVKT